LLYNKRNNTPLYRYPEYMLSRLPIVMEDQELAHLYLSQLLYISYLVTLIQLNQKQLKNRKSNFPHTPTIVSIHTGGFLSNE